MAKLLPNGLSNPATSEPDYSDEEREFMTAMERYKRVCRRPYPTCREVLMVLTSMGYRKVAPSQLDALIGK